MLGEDQHGQTNQPRRTVGGAAGQKTLTPVIKSIELPNRVPFPFSDLSQAKLRQPWCWRRGPRRLDSMYEQAIW